MKKTGRLVWSDSLIEPPRDGPLIDVFMPEIRKSVFWSKALLKAIQEDHSSATVSILTKTRTDQ